MEREIWIIGGGPSLRGFSWERLKGRPTIGINEAYVHHPRYLFWSDLTWYAKRKEALKDYPHTAFHTVCAGNYERKVTIWSKDQLGSGLNSGLSSIYLAYRLGYTTVNLLGFDMGYPTGKTHWHNEYSSTAQRSLMQTWLPQFERVTRDLKGITVWNCNPQSNLKTFPFREFT